jgi:hypothetical protein
VTADEFPRVGEAIAKITTTQPLVIRPVLPRQLVLGDRVLISAIVQQHDRDRTAIVWAEFNTASGVEACPFHVAVRRRAAGQRISGKR